MKRRLDSTDPASKAILSDTFLQSLMAAPNEQALRRLIEERARLVANAKAWLGTDHKTHQGPISRDQVAFNPRPVANGKTFAKAIMA